MTLTAVVLAMGATVALFLIFTFMGPRSECGGQCGSCSGGTCQSARDAHDHR
jgi:hypothetical protein